MGNRLNLVQYPEDEFGVAARMYYVLNGKKKRRKNSKIKMPTR